MRDLGSGLEAQEAVKVQATHQQTSTQFPVTGSYYTPHTDVALGFIVVSTHDHRAPLHQRHDPLEVPLVDDASVVLEGLRTVCVKLLQGEKHKTGTLITSPPLVGH